jgi:hypothetical protein
MVAAQSGPRSPGAIARRDAGEETLMEIARSYNVSHSTISRALRSGREGPCAGPGEGPSVRPGGLASEDVNFGAAGDLVSYQLSDCRTITDQSGCARGTPAAQIGSVIETP